MLKQFTRKGPRIRKKLPHPLRKTIPHPPRFKKLQHLLIAPIKSPEQNILQIRNTVRVGPRPKRIHILRKNHRIPKNQLREKQQKRVKGLGEILMPRAFKKRMRPSPKPRITLKESAIIERTPLPEKKRKPLLRKQHLGNRIRNQPPSNRLIGTQPQTHELERIGNVHTHIPHRSKTRILLNRNTPSIRQ